MFPMAQGNGDAVRKELTEAKKYLKGGEILIFGQGKSAVFASSKDRQGVELAKLIKLPELTEAVQELLRTGKTTDRIYEEWIDGKPYFTMLQPIIKDSSCRQRHPGNEVAQGGMIVRQSLETMHDNIMTQRCKNIGVALAGCFIIVLALYFVIAKLVTRSIERRHAGEQWHGPVDQFHARNLFGQ